MNYNEKGACRKQGFFPAPNLVLESKRITMKRGKRGHKKTA
jgi:hypothetical protein